MAHKTKSTRHIVSSPGTGRGPANGLDPTSKLEPPIGSLPVLFCGQGGMLDSSALETGIRVRFVPKLIRQSWPWWDLWALVNLCRFLREEKPDIVHTRFLKSGGIGTVGVLADGGPRGGPYRTRVWLYPGPAFLGPRTICFFGTASCPITTAFVFVSRANRADSLAKGIGQEHQMHLIRAAVPLRAYFELTHRRESPTSLTLTRPINW